jgi:hypothetical protein
MTNRNVVAVASHATANGNRGWRVFGDAVARRFLRGRPQRASTSRMRLAAPRRLQGIDVTRSRGWCLAEEQAEAGVRAIAVTIKGRAAHRTVSVVDSHGSGAARGRRIGTVSGGGRDWHRFGGDALRYAVSISRCDDRCWHGGGKDGADGV